MESKEWKGNIAEESTDHVYDPLQQQKPKDSASTCTFHIMLYTSVLGITHFICDSMIVGRNHEIERLVLEPRPYWDVLYSNHLLAEDVKMTMQDMGRNTFDYDLPGQSLQHEVNPILH